MSPRPIRRGVLAALAATLLVAAPAGAHPFFEPDEVPVDSVAELRLQLAHGCTAGHDDADETADEEPTREVAIEVPDAVAWVEPAETQGWDLELERDGDGRAEVIVYTAADGTDEEAPGFDLEAVHRGEVDDEVHWRVLQACDEGTHRWVGTDEDPAEEPAVTVTLAAVDPDSPPPPEAEPDEDGSGDLAGDADDSDGVDEPDEPLDDPIEAPEEDPDGEDLTADEAGEAMPGWLLIVVLLVTLAIAAVVLLQRNRDDAGTGTG